jgi:hypothetical protein
LAHVTGCKTAFALMRHCAVGSVSMMIELGEPELCPNPPMRAEGRTTSPQIPSGDSYATLSRAHPVVAALPSRGGDASSEPFPPPRGATTEGHMDGELFGVAGVFICESLEGGSAWCLIYAERA